MPTQVLLWNLSVTTAGWTQYLYLHHQLILISLVAQMVKHLPTMQETWVQSVGREDLLEKEMATHSSILS